MYCKKCQRNISPDCVYTNGICVFCTHKISEWDSNGQVITKKEATLSDRNYKQCINKDKDECVIWSACNDCYHYEYDELICPYCLRIMPNKDFRKHFGCKWCQR